MNTSAKRFQLVELQVPTAGLGAGQRLYFQDQPQLRTDINQIVTINAIDTYQINAVAKSPSGNAVASAADLANAFLVLNVMGTEELQYIPLVTLNRFPDFTAGDPTAVDQFTLQGVTNIDWTKSYLQFGAAQAGPVSFLFGVYYQYTPSRQK